MAALAGLGGEGFEEFVHAEIPRLLPLARALTRGGHDASDLVQDTLVRVGIKWSSVRKDGNPHAYARTTLVRLHINARRNRGRESVTAEPPDSRSADLADEIVGRAWLRSALDSLSPRQRAVVALRYVEDLTMAQIGQALGCSEGTAKSQLSRALATLRVTTASPFAEPRESRHAD